MITTKMCLFRFQRHSNIRNFADFYQVSNIKNDTDADSSCNLKYFYLVIYVKYSCKFIHFLATLNPTPTLALIICIYLTPAANLTSALQTMSTLTPTLAYQILILSTRTAFLARFNITDCSENFVASSVPIINDFTRKVIGFISRHWSGQSNKKTTIA